MRVAVQQGHSETYHCVCMICSYWMHQNGLAYRNLDICGLTRLMGHVPCSCRCHGETFVMLRELLFLSKSNSGRTVDGDWWPPGGFQDVVVKPLHSQIPIRDLYAGGFPLRVFRNNYRQNVNRLFHLSEKWQCITSWRRRWLSPFFDVYLPVYFHIIIAAAMQYAAGKSDEYKTIFADAKQNNHPSIWTLTRSSVGTDSDGAVTNGCFFCCNKPNQQDLPRCLVSMYCNHECQRTTGNRLV
jgi:hypothetical protein